MLMECLSGNVGMDLNHDFIPAEHKQKFYAEMARYQVSGASSSCSLCHLNISVDGNLINRVSEDRGYYQTSKWHV